MRPSNLTHSFGNEIAPDRSRIAVSRAQRLDPNDAYLYLLCIALAGYALLGKGFAYLGYPPLLIGEVTMVLGLVAIYLSGCGLAMLATLPSILLVALLFLVVLKTLLSFGQHGLDAVRDSVIVVYGLYAFVVIALLLEKPERLKWVVQAYGRFAWLYGLIGGTVYYVTSVFQDMLPVWPTSGVSVVYVRLGEAAVHLAGAATFVLLGLRKDKVSLLWLLVLVLGIVMVTPSRGAMLACIVPIAAAAVLGAQLKRFGRALLLGAALFAATYVAGLDIPLPGGRSIGPTQIINNVESLVGSSEAANLDGTKLWRLRWWKAIQDYTFNGPYFWTGKGFGINLAEADGFVVGTEFNAPLVRVPHNAHLTMLARAGVPGLALWVATGVFWFGMLTRNIIIARRRGDIQWANLFLWIGCYAGSIVIDASFDVALEGPMLGIWFWSLFGFGIAASMIYRWDIKSGNLRELV